MKAIKNIVARAKKKPTPTPTSLFELGQRYILKGNPPGPLLQAIKEALV